MNLWNNRKKSRIARISCKWNKLEFDKISIQCVFSILGFGLLLEGLVGMIVEDKSSCTPVCGADIDPSESSNIPAWQTLTRMRINPDLV